MQEVEILGEKQTTLNSVTYLPSNSIYNRMKRSPMYNHLGIKGAVPFHPLYNLRNKKYLHLQTMPNTTPTESEVQMMLVDYLSILENQKKVLWFCSSANGQFQKSIMVKMKMKREWVRAWYPDMTIIFPKNIIFIELKREKWWYPTEDQKKVIEAINKAWDHWNCSAYIAYWFEEAKKIIDWYI